jgi:hypothetical protein
MFGQQHVWSALCLANTNLADTIFGQHNIWSTLLLFAWHIIGLGQCLANIIFGHNLLFGRHNIWPREYLADTIFGINTYLLGTLLGWGNVWPT